MKQLPKTQGERLPVSQKSEWTQGIWNYRHDFPSWHTIQNTAFTGNVEAGLFFVLGVDVDIWDKEIGLGKISLS